MKHTILKTLLIALGALAFIAPHRLDAQAKKTDKNQKVENYNLKEGQQIHREYVDRILTRKMRQLEQYLTALIKKEDPNYMRIVDKAMLLFNNDETKLITVTNKNTGKVYVKPVKEYLTALAKLPYKSVDITYRNYTAINNIRRQPDGTFKGIVVFQQEFTGYDKEGMAQYHDVIQRNAEVTIKEKEYPVDETHHKVTMDIFFGNMGATEMQ